MADYIRLSEPPTLSYRSPECGACMVETEWEDGPVCPQCGTGWGASASDGDAGELYPDWAGEDLPGPTIPVDDAWQIPTVRGPKRDSAIRRFAPPRGTGTGEHHGA